MFLFRVTWKIRLFQNNYLMKKVNILLASHTIPKPDWNGGDLRFFSIIKLLAKNYNVDLWISNKDSLLAFEKHKRYEKKIIETGANLLPIGISLPRILIKNYYDIGIFEFYHFAEVIIPIFRQLQPHAKVIVDSVDVHFLREMSGVKLGIIDNTTANINKEKELEVYRKADCVIAVTDSDYKELSKTLNNTSISIIPTIHKIRKKSQKFQNQEVLFVGGV